MVARNNPKTESDEEALVITRVFDAPRELVFKAWTEPERFVQWWGPNGFTTPHCEIDARPGGVISFCMRSEEMGDIWAAGVFQEVDPPSRLVYTAYFTDPDGNKVPATHYGMSADLPLEMLVSVTFEEYEGKTKMTLEHAIPQTVPEREGAQQGWGESFDRLDAYLTGV
jgi:uncharacterized protein YndB with AHSA1/START domain